MAIASLHYYFFWAMKTLVKWTVFCVVTGREPRLDLDTRRYFEIGDRTDLCYDEKLAAYRRLADEYFETERYHDFCASRLGHLDELVLEWAGSAELDRLLVATVRSTYPAHEQERFLAHFRGLTGQWVREQAPRPRRPRPARHSREQMIRRFPPRPSSDWPRHGRQGRPRREDRAARRPFSPGIVGDLNDYKLAVVRVQGEFVWHGPTRTPTTSSSCSRGQLTIQLRDRDVVLERGLAVRGAEGRRALPARPTTRRTSC